MLFAIQIVAMISGITLIASVVMQTTKADSFSAAMGSGAEASKFRPGSREDWLQKITKASAVVWLAAMVVCAIIWYRSR